MSTQNLQPATRPLNIVILDGFVTNPNDVSWEPVERLGQVKVYDRTNKEDLYDRTKDTDILITNKRQIDHELIDRLDQLKCICLLSTGYNSVDIAAAKNRGITVCNAVGYSGTSVAQHVFALLLELTNNVGLHNNSVQNNEWATSIDWCYWKKPIMELANKTMGIYGLGKIGQEVAKIALAFGMKVIATRRNVEKPNPLQIPLVSFEELLTKSDVLSLHAPLSGNNSGIINKQNLSQMKPTALLINTGRGGLVNEADLKTALITGTIAGAGLDVLSAEPPPMHHPLLSLPNCIITPHNAWVSRESRERLIQIVADNIAAFLKGAPQNVVV